MAPFKQTTLPAHLKHPHAGRPTTYRPEYCEMVIVHMAKGKSLTAFAGSIRVSADAVYDWIRAYPEFSDAVSRARSARVDSLETKLLASRKGAETTAAIFALKNASPHEWKDVKYQQHNHSVTVEELTTAQLNAIAAGVSPADAGVIEGDYELIDTRPATPKPEQER